jgi:TonB family protein
MLQRPLLLSALAFLLLLGLFSTSVADRQEEFEKLPPELSHVKVYEIAVPLKRVEPKYPKPALEKGIETDVWLKALISQEGRVIQSGVVFCGEKNLGFEYAARAAASEFEFEPKMSAGKPQTCWCYFRIPFRIPADTATARDSFPGPDEFVPVDVLPEMIERVPPVYPDSCRLHEISGTLWVKALVDIDGKVRDAHIVKGSGTDCGLAEAALAAARKTRFKPALVDGRPVAVWVTYKVEFALE